MSRQDRPCGVPECPAWAEVGGATCGPHRDARLAKALGIAKDAGGHGGKCCITCRRRFAETDWVYRQILRRANVRKTGEQFGHAHVRCEPVTQRLSRKAIKESPKPLLEVAE